MMHFYFYERGIFHLCHSEEQRMLRRGNLGGAAHQTDNLVKLWCEVLSVLY